jgi:magnesium-transporting ATPase (P-type)
MDPSKPANAKPPDIASASIPDTLATLHVNPDTGLTQAEVDASRKEHGYNEVAVKKEHPVLQFLRKFWGISAWMLELIMILSAALRKFSDLVVVGALLVINAVLSFMQERRAAGVVEELQRKLQVSARVRRDSNWQVIPARELVPGDIVRVRPGDIIPADVKLLTGGLTADESALTGESKDVDKAPGAVLSSGSIVRRGEGNGVVMLTGAKTYFGRSSIARISNVAAQPAGLGDLGGNQPSLHDSQRRNRTETCYRAPSSVHAPNKKGEYASTKSQKHNAYDEGNTLPHNELAQKNGS